MAKVTKEEFIEMFGEDPIDVLGQDWRNQMDEYDEESKQAEQAKRDALEEAERPRKN